MVNKQMAGFLEFIREQGVIGLAVGFILGGAISKVVTSLVNDIINPLLGVLLGAAGDMADKTLVMGGATLKYGAFINTMIDFMVIALVIYTAVRVLGVDKLDKKK